MGVPAYPSRRGPTPMPAVNPMMIDRGQSRARTVYDLRVAQ
jgi:hypothetical protein